jgi:hypothetical protein
MSDDTTPIEDAPEEMSLRASEAFAAYYDLGPGRSLRKLADLGTFGISQLERWSSAYGWQQLAKERHQEEQSAARDAAKREAASLARRRLRNAQLLQEAGLTILARAKIAEMDEESAQKLLGDARQMMVEGMRAERLELGESTENVRQVTPPKPIGQMDDDELDAYIALLDEEG